MSAPYFIAAVDFGKTNKKVLLYDQDLRWRAVRRKTFTEIEIDGYRCDDLDGAMAFVGEALRSLALEYDPIRAVSFTTHGAAFLVLDRDGKRVFPPVSYDMEPPAELAEEFYAAFGSRTELQAGTMTPPLPFLINPGLGMFFLKRRDPDRFARARHILFLPQYLGYLLTGRMALDPTSIGCHTYLWDFERQAPSHVAEGLGVADLLDVPWRRPWDVQGTVAPGDAARLRLPAGCVVTCGVHDSNASLLPYLLKEPGGDFVLNSTGTWCVAMSPGGRFPLSPEELGKEVFFNLSVFGTPVKTTIFRGGAEFAFWSERLGRSVPHPEDMDGAALARVMSEGAAVLPTLFPGSGMFPRSRASLIRAELLLDEPLLAHMALDLGLAIQSRAAIMAAARAGAPAIFVEGGFKSNGPYTRLLAALLPQCRVYLSDLEEATAFGAAILGVCAVEGCEPAQAAARFEIKTVRVPPAPIDGLEEYARRFVALTEMCARD